MYCRHCPDHEHEFVCNCGHHHTRHNYGGGCTGIGCPCEAYNQSMQRLPNETWPRLANVARQRSRVKKARYRV